ncbi:flagellar export protein FliJ [Candidatus Sumerlaeota bacterium]|nr:flagellar export protein FliJ [Candidatus Sumerlaeota bacterium]
MFHFSLEEVLEYRLTLQDERQREYTAAQSRLNDAEQFREALRHARVDAAMDLSLCAEHGIPPHEYLLRQRHLDGLALQIRDQDERVVQLRRIAEIRRQHLVEALREVETLEALKKEELKAYEYDERRQEMKEMNDFAVFQFSRREREKNAVEEKVTQS